VARNEHRFGSLERRRARILRIICESLVPNPLRHVQLKRTPVLCLYGRQDRILDMYWADGDTGYQQAIRRHCPKVQFEVMEGDHFLSGRRTRHNVLQTILAFL
jgi:pimeloyl-ACP methyl ester carboxylesterase